jgi:enoyl-CoA hydratase/carnithine racemase
MSTLIVTEFSRLAVDIHSSVGRIVLRNSPLNVVDIRMMEELTSALSEIESRPDVAVILLSGEGKCFSAGVDVAAHTPDKVEEMLQKFHAVIRALVATRKVTIAMVQETAWVVALNWRWFATSSIQARRHFGDFRRLGWVAIRR